MLKQLGQALYPIGASLSKALGMPVFTPDEVKSFDVQGEEDGIPNVYSSSIYGISATHVLVGVALGVVMAKPLGLVKPVTRYRRARAARRTARK